MVTDEKDFFGLECIGQEEIPRHLIPERNHTKEEVTGKRIKHKQKSPNYFDEQFFPHINKEEPRNNETSEITKHQHVDESDFFEEHFLKSSGSSEQHIIRNMNAEDELNNFDVKAVDETRLHGEKDIWGKIDPIWKYTHEELVEYMSKRVIYQTDDVIAFDKPTQMAYACSTKDQAQMDRILQDVKKIVSPETSRLNLVSSLDKECSGVLIFAKSKERENKLKKLIADGHALYRYRCLVKGNPDQEKTRIAIPLIKVTKDKNMKLCPLSGTAKKKEQLYHLNTDIKIVNENRQAQISLIDAFIKQPIHHVVRSHCYYGINCPIIGEKKYIKGDPFAKGNGKFKFDTQAFRLSYEAMTLLNLSKAAPRRLPLYFHLAEVHLPESTGGKFSIIKVDLPEYFKYTLKRLNLLRK